VTLKVDWTTATTFSAACWEVTFLFLSYSATDQSQVQRYLTALDCAEPAGLLFNAMAKIRMAVLYFVHRRHGVRVYPIRGRRCYLQRAERLQNRIRAPYPAIASD